MAEALPEYPDSDFSDEDLSPLDISFNNATDHVRKITSKLNNGQLLELYGLFKQSTEGNCNTPKPGWLDGRGRKKWEAWKALQDMPSEDAKEKYVALVEKYDPEWFDGNIEKKGDKEAWVAVSSLRYSPEPELVHNELSILEAAREDLGDRVQELLTKYPELKTEKDEEGLSALHWAADRDAVSALTAAIEGGCDINDMDDSGQTALHYAASCGHISSTKLLIKYGAAMLKDEEGNTPLDLAADDEIRNILEAAQ
ncbi:Acyl-CoA-binding domain-containing protein 6 [Papilio machaon]|uniref:Acyl-CoA-binding domain-containing protein 6 n=1 Tax=Papilio machaon TaxID=76193 RepID=A0A194QX08_PAPMA|nr:Acyl-CoA-binding domain-containing protein 6 [Papilio machaon]